MSQVDPTPSLNPAWIPLIDAFTGNNWDELASISGYTKKHIQNLFKKPEVMLALTFRHKRNQHIQSVIAGRRERQKFWTNVMRDKKENIYARMRASELLGKSEGDFVQRSDREDPELGKIPAHIRRQLAQQYKRTTQAIPDKSLRQLEKGKDGVYRVPEPKTG